MRTLYLIRHGEPDFPNGERICLGQTDLPLSTLGRLQGAVLGAFLPGIPAGNVFSSPLIRARDTASFLGPVTVAEDLKEHCSGLFEGLPFSEIRKRYPDLYEQRGNDPYHTLIPGADLPSDTKRRILHCLDAILARTEGDIAAVTHAGVSRLYLLALNAAGEKDYIRLKLPYTGVTKLVLDKGVLTPAYIGRAPAVKLTRELCLRLLQAAGTPENIVRHSLAVEKRALELAEGRPVDRELLSCAALLHDMLRTEPFHERAAADALEALGYTEVASLVRTHSDIPAECADSVCEASLLFLADKTVSGDAPVTLEERFRTTLKKCTTPEALEAHARRFAQAGHILSLLERS